MARAVITPIVSPSAEPDLVVPGLPRTGSRGAPAGRPRERGHPFALTDLVRATSASHGVMSREEGGSNPIE